VNEKVLPWLEHSAEREDYFLHINYWDVHRCYKMDASWADRFGDQPVPQAWPDPDTIARHQELGGSFTARGQFRDGRSPWSLMPDAVTSRADFDHMLTGYDAAIAYTDQHVADVLDVLARKGVLDEAVIIISGDHGDAFGEHGIYSDHVCADECIHRIPLVVRWPGATAAARSDAFLYNVDFAPTLCEMLGIDAAADWDGKSFAGNIDGSGELDRDYLVGDTGLYTVQRAVRTERHLMIRTYDDYGYAFEPLELYDLQDDPYQTRNLAADATEVVGSCSALMEEWVQQQMAKDHWVSDPLSEILRERGAPGASA